MNVLHALTRRRGAALTFLALAVVVALVALAAGCGGSSATTTSTSPTPAASGSTAAATWTAADLASVTDRRSRSRRCCRPASRARAIIKCLSDIPYPPWEYFDPPDSKNPAGFDYDLSQALGKKMGVTVEFIDKPFDSILLQIKGGNGDMSMSAMYDNQERQDAGFSFVDYTFDGTGMLVVKGNPNGINEHRQPRRQDGRLRERHDAAGVPDQAQQGVRRRRQGEDDRSSHSRASPRRSSRSRATAPSPTSPTIRRR